MSIQVKALSKRIDNREILRGITFTWQPGRIVGLVGRNGVGKTTLFRTMADHYLADAQQIDQLNIYEATRVAMAQAVRNLSVRPTRLLVDAMQVPVPIEQTRLIKGDAKSASISAASIVAKVVRDHLMTMYDQVYPGYDFADNMGYGTAKHLAGLASLGATPIHRQSFSPVRNAKRV